MRKLLIEFLVVNLNFFGGLAVIIAFSALGGLFAWFITIPIWFSFPNFISLLIWSVRQRIPDNEDLKFLLILFLITALIGITFFWLRNVLMRQEKTK